MGSRVQYPSIPELKDGFEDLTNRIARKAKLKFRGRKLRSGPLHNAVMLHFLMLPEQAQIEIAEASLRRYEALLQLDEPADDLGSILAGEVEGAERVVGFAGRVGKGRTKPKGKDKAPEAD